MALPAQTIDLARAAPDAAGSGPARADLVMPGLHCAGCIARVERCLTESPGVVSARVNLSLKRTTVEWDPAQTTLDDLIKTVEARGFEARQFAATDTNDDDEADHSRFLLRSLAVAGFAAGNDLVRPRDTGRIELFACRTDFDDPAIN